jgi:hypothetical protein
VQPAFLNMFLLFGLLGPAILMGIRLGTERSEELRARMLLVYMRDGPIMLRNVMPLAPVWAAGSAMIGLPFILPLPWPAYLAGLGLPVAGLAFALSYRVPAPLMPGWLKTEVESGRIAVARPDRWDWTLFWLTVPLGFVGVICWYILVAWGKAAT